MLKIDYLNYSVGQKELLNITNLTLANNGLYAVVGLNGSGKSLFCKALARQLEGVRSSIFYNDVAIANLEPIDYAKTISYLELSSVENSFFNAEQTILSGYYGQTRQFDNDNSQSRQAMLNLLSRLDLDEAILKQSFATLSLGERGRVLLIRNLLADSPILILDEVLANLDLKHELATLAFLQQLAATKIIILVSHNLSLLGSYAHYLIALKAGTIYSYGDFVSNFNEAFLLDCFGLKATLQPKKQGSGYHLEF